MDKCKAPVSAASLPCVIAANAMVTIANVTAAAVLGATKSGKRR